MVYLLRNAMIVCLFIAIIAATNDCRAQQSKDGVQWLRSAREAAELSESTGKPILVYVRSSDCHFCDLMQKNVWEDPATAQLVMREFVPLKLTREENQAAVDAMKVKGFPSTLLFSPGLQYMGRLDGYLPKDRFLNDVSTMRAAGTWESQTKR